MIKLEKENAKVQLVQMVEQTKSGFDIAGKEWDWGTYFECPTSLGACKDDYYNKLMYLFGCNIYIEEYRPDWYTITTVESFIKDNIEIFKKFIEETWKEEYIPDWNSFNLDDEEFYDIFLIDVMEKLLCGSYSENDYKLLYNLFMEEK